MSDAARLSGGNSKPVSLRGYLFARSAREREAREVLALLDSLGTQRYIPPYAHALIHLGLGEYDRAFDHLHRALSTHDVHLAFLPNDVKWDPVRDDPRFQTLIARCQFVTR